MGKNTGVQIDIRIKLITVLDSVRKTEQKFVTMFTEGAMKSNSFLK